MGGEQLRRQAAVLVWIGAGLGLVACRQILGVEEREPTPPDPVQYVDPLCEQCVSDNCSAEDAACRANDGCLTRQACLAGCTAVDADCRADCHGGQAVVAGAGLELEVCRAQRCEGSCDRCGSSAFDFRAAACSECMVAQCCAEATAYAQQPECGRELRRYLACTDPFCVWDASLALVPSGSAVLYCAVKCDAECQWGTDWRCVGAYTIPEPTADTAIRRLELVNAATNATIDGVEITGCESEECLNPLPADGPTIDGIATVEVPTGFTGHLEFRHDDYVTHRAYSSLPTVSDVREWFPMLPNAVLSVLEDQMGTTFEPARGLVLVTGYDCSSSWVMGATMTLSTADQQTVLGYFGGIGIDPHLTSTVDMGSALFANVPVGPTMATVKDAAGRAVGVAGGQVVAGQLTHLEVYPWLLD